MTDIKYNHEFNVHSLEGAIRAFEYLALGRQINSLLDVGAGTGNWLFAAGRLGIKDILGLDGVPPNHRQVWVAPELIQCVDLRTPFRLGRRFDAALCLEVAEHLPPECARPLIETLCIHSNLIFFSAAAPGQHGDHHVNCRWPTYWQELFNTFGYVCRDEVRVRMWNDSAIEPWYRQNLISAERDPNGAGKEPRVQDVIHPEMVPVMDFPNSPMAMLYINLERGMFHPFHYLKLFERSVRRRFGALLYNR